MVRVVASSSSQPVTLNYRLGEIHLFSATLRGRIVDANFIELAESGQAARLLEETEATGLKDPAVEVVLLRSIPTANPLPRLTRLHGVIRYVPRQYERYYVRTAGTFADYLAGFSSKSRSTLARKVRKFEQHSGGKIHWQEYRGAGTMREFHTLARSISRRTYQEQLLDAGLPDTDDFRDDMEQLARDDKARGYLLFHDGRPVAYLFSPLREGVLLYQYVGYDPEFAKWSPGTVLQFLVLERVFDDPAVAAFDFTEGEGQHKEQFSNASVNCADVYYLRPTLRCAALTGLHWAVDQSTTLAGRASALVGGKQRLKKFIRAVAGRFAGRRASSSSPQ